MADAFNDLQWFNQLVRSVFDDLLDTLELCAFVKRLTTNAVEAHMFAEVGLRDLFLDVFNYVNQVQAIRQSPAPKLSVLLFALQHLGRTRRLTMDLEDAPAPFDAGDPLAFTTLPQVPDQERVEKIWHQMLCAMRMDESETMPDDVRTLLERLLRDGLIDPAIDDLPAAADPDDHSLELWGHTMDVSNNEDRWEYAGSDADADIVFDGVFAIASDLHALDQARVNKARSVIRRMSAHIEEKANRDVFESITSGQSSFEELAAESGVAIAEIIRRFFEALDNLQAIFRDAFQHGNFRYELEGLFPELFLDLLNREFNEQGDTES